MALYLCNMHKYLQAFGKIQDIFAEVIRIEYHGEPFCAVDIQAEGDGNGLVIRVKIICRWDQVPTVVNLIDWKLVGPF